MMRCRAAVYGQYTLQSGHGGEELRTQPLELPPWCRGVISTPSAYPLLDDHQQLPASPPPQAPGSHAARSVVAAAPASASRPRLPMIPHCLPGVADTGGVRRPRPPMTPRCPLIPRRLPAATNTGCAGHPHPSMTPRCPPIPCRPPGATGTGAAGRPRPPMIALCPLILRRLPVERIPAAVRHPLPSAPP